MLDFLPKLSENDVSRFLEESQKGQTLGSEDFEKDLYLNFMIDKPWGHEYRVYADSLIDIWKLQINRGHSTSMHCHPRKETLLICLNGTLRVRVFLNSVLLQRGDYVRLPKGVFHSTENVDPMASHILEVEVPRNKLDLIRIKDRYGREGQKYEKPNQSPPIHPMCKSPGIFNSKIRNHCIDNIFEFNVAMGSEIINSPTSSDYSVLISTESAINQKIEVFKKNTGDYRHILPHSPYFIITES